MYKPLANGVSLSNRLCPCYNFYRLFSFTIDSCSVLLLLMLFVPLQQSECWKEENETGSDPEVQSGELFRSDSRCFLSNIIREVQRCACVCMFVARVMVMYLILFTLFYRIIFPSTSPSQAVATGTGAQEGTGSRSRWWVLIGWTAHQGGALRYVYIGIILLLIFKKQVMLMWLAVSLVNILSKLLKRFLSLVNNDACDIGSFICMFFVGARISRCSFLPWQAFMSLSWSNSNVTIQAPPLTTVFHSIPIQVSIMQHVKPASWFYIL